MTEKSKILLGELYLKIKFDIEQTRLRELN